MEDRPSSGTLCTVVDQRAPASRKSAKATATSLFLAAAAAGCLPGALPVDDVFPELPAGARVELADVAVAWPLPGGTGASEPGFLGPILDCDVISVFEALTRDDEPAALCGALTVTAARLDPCFREFGPDSVCQPQLRLSLQPVFEGSARDAALHAFFDVDEATTLRAAAQLIALRLGAGDDGRHALGVSPALTTVEGREAAAAVITEVLGRARLDHITEITVHGGNAAWTFEERTFVDGVVAGGEARQQHLLSVSPAAIDISITPVSASPDEFSLLLNDETARAAPLADQQAAFDRAARVENPDFYSAGTIDCATCHAAAPARAAALGRSTLTPSPEGFTSARHDLTSSAVFSDAQFIHAFGYRLTTLTINQRVVNEAAVSADLIDARLTDEGVLR